MSLLPGWKLKNISGWEKSGLFVSSPDFMLMQEVHSGLEVLCRVSCITFEYPVNLTGIWIIFVEKRKFVRSGFAMIKNRLNMFLRILFLPWIVVPCRPKGLDLPTVNVFPICFILHIPRTRTHLRRN